MRQQFLRRIERRLFAAPPQPERIRGLLLAIAIGVFLALAITGVI